MNTTTTIYGIHNCALYNTRPEGDAEFFESEEERDKAISELRSEGEWAGLDSHALSEGIREIEITQADMDKGVDLTQWLEWYNDSHTGEKHEMLLEIGL